MPAGDTTVLDADWPNRSVSAFVQAGGLRWHVQRMGQGEPLLLVHGTGASVHSWRALMPLLSQSYSVLAVDLPGHGFTSAPAPAAHSLDGMAAALARLLLAMEVQPKIVVGHSAGAAILAQGCLDGTLRPRAFISLCGALLPLEGLRDPLSAQFARGMVGLPFVPQMLAWRAGDPTMFAALMRATGSQLDTAGIEYYRRLALRATHVSAALDMMAQWDLCELERELPRLATPLLLVSAEDDPIVPLSHARSVQALVKRARLRTLAGLGHLAHEEQPGQVAALIEEFAARPR